MQRTWHQDLRFAYLIEPPFCYHTPANAVTGCDVEVARTVIHAIGGQCFIPVETEFAELLPGLADGRWNMTTGLFATDERRRYVEFSRPVWALTDGLLVRAGNADEVSGYRSIADNDATTLAVITDQVQHDTAQSLGVPEPRIRQFSTYQGAADAVLEGVVDAYASVAMAHRGYLTQNPESKLAVVDAPVCEKVPEFGAFAFSTVNDGLRQAVDAELEKYLGSPDHRALMATFGFADADIDLVASA